MNLLIQRFWNEPAAAISVLSGLGNALRIIIVSAVYGHLKGAAIVLALGAVGPWGLLGVRGAGWIDARRVQLAAVVDSRSIVRRCL
jgi:hypothetical protein